MGRPRPIRNAWYATRHVLGSHRVGFPFLRLMPNPKVMVGRDSDVCIDGFPRSGNTFAFHAFKQWNPEAEVAHHVHATQQILRALRFGVPCVLLVRDPLDTISSLIIFNEGELSHSLATRSYVDFHRRVATVRDRVAVCDFAEVTAEPSTMVQRLNAAAGTSFHSEPMGPEARQELLATIERYHRHRNRRTVTFSVPSPGKEELKPEVRQRVAGDPHFAEAQAVYRELVASR